MIPKVAHYVVVLGRNVDGIDVMLRDVQAPTRTLARLNYTHGPAFWGDLAIGYRIVDIVRCGMSAPQNRTRRRIIDRTLSKLQKG